ncbi:zinc-binding alcohol dehydrogenase [Halorientalis brevis]|uniref:Zinc-binding alcohol dehydrogenase n=1 Tax=Halorientalis brevis TaxID=1126241 RepID=A0ABD6CBZ5_9EURY|nr:zinc-binding alcohol dehydrogenase [Halorientalis brevis]
MATDSTRQSLYFTDAESVTVEERPIPACAAEEVRVETHVSAISPGTELLVFHGEAPAELLADDPIDAVGGETEFPMQYGYAAVGEVNAVGEHVPDWWRGERVFAFHPHESHFVAEPSTLLRVPETCQTDQAALVPNVETAVNFLMDGRPMIGERVVVFGQGIVGLLTTALLAECPVETVVTVECLEHRRALSRQFGADAVIDPESADVAGAVRERLDGNGADLAIEVSGDPAALDDAIAATGENGRVVVGSCYGTKRAELDLGGYFHRSRIDVKASQVSTIDPVHRGRWSKDRRLDEAWRWLDSLDASPLITDRVPVEAAPTAYERLDDAPNSTLQVLLTYP